MKKALLLWGLIALSVSCFAQTLPAGRRTDWLKAGFDSVQTQFSHQINIIDSGAIGNGVFSNAAILQRVINNCTQPTIIYFPAGTYFFDTTIYFNHVNAKNNVIIRGEDSGATVFTFDGGGPSVSRDFFSVTGATSISRNLKANTVLGASYLRIDNTVNLNVNDYIRIYQKDAALVGSDLLVVGQLAKITGKNGDTLFIRSPLRKAYTLADSVKIVRYVPRKWIGFEHFKVERLDSTNNESSTFFFRYAVDCWVKGVESYKTNHAHVALNYSSNCEVDSSYFHHSHGYGGGWGQAIGVMITNTSGECRIQNSIFAHLRQGVLLSRGANGNVYAYNYSTDPYWDQYPSNRAPDINFHGDYPYMNLVEGNVGQYIHVDNSHGINGPYNTFLRNRAELYGIRFANTNETAQNLLGNEVTHERILLYNDTGALAGILGEYLVEARGTGHYRFRNWIRCSLDSASVADSINAGLSDTSYVYAAKPSFLGSGYAWPGIGLTNSFVRNAIPAKVRYFTITGLSDTVAYVSCGALRLISSPVTITPEVYTLKVYPNPVHSSLTVTFPATVIGKVARYVLYNNHGQLLRQWDKVIQPVSSLDMQPLEPGLYLLTIHSEGFRHTYKIMKQ